MSRQKIIDVAASQNHTKENPPNSNKTKYGEWYGLNGVPWCAIFVSWVYDQAGHPLGQVDTPKGYQYCPSAYNFWKAHNRFTDDPQMGDIVLFDWDGDGKCDHTGIFIAWVDPGKTFTSWEGNTAVNNDSDGGEVMMRTRKRSVVRAFVNPGIFSDTIALAATVLKRGSTGSGVTLVQRLLYELGFKMIIDGDFGPGTEKAVKDFQQSHGLAVTGEVDNATENAIESEHSKPKVSDKKLTTGIYLKKGSAGPMVLALQKALNKKGVKPAVTEDGMFGQGTVDALKVFQKKNILTVDGVAGPETLGKLGIK